MVEQLTHYSILGISNTATQEEIGAAFTQLMGTGKVSTDPLAHKRLVYAYRVLGNRNTRAAYDSQLQSSIKAGETEDDALAVRLVFSREELGTSESPQLLYGLLEITAVDPNEEVNPPLNISIVIDRSTSMNGVRIERVKTAITNFIKNLAPDDVVSIISFSDRAQIVHPSGRVANKASIITKIRSIRTSGGTEIYQGLSASVQQIKQADLSQYNNQIILLTDGHTYGDAESCLHLAEKIARQNIEITAFGIGNEWNDHFLDMLVAPSAGRSIYINHPEDIVDNLQQSIEGLGNIYAHNLCVHPQFTDSIQVRNIFKLMPFAQPVSFDNKQIRLGHLETRTPLTVLFELEISPQGVDTELPISIGFSADLLHKNGRSCRQYKKHNLPIRLNATPSEPSPEILKAVRLFNLYQMNEKAWNEAEAGQFDMATARMQHISTRLLEAGEEALSQQAFAETQRLASMETVSIEGRKGLKYGTRALMQQFSDEG